MHEEDRRTVERLLPAGSDELYRILGLSRDQATLVALEELIHPDDRELAQRQLQGATEPGKTWDIELRLVLHDGAGKVVHAKGEAVSESSGQVQLLVGTVQDISERKRLEAQLRESEKMATMGEIVAAVAHEVRNPLFALSATLDAFEARAHDRETCSPLAAEREVELERAWPEDLPAASHDRRRLLRVFVNVIKNAIEHSPRGGAVHIEARERMSDGSPRIECWVHDSGPGFPEDGLTKVFEPFYSRRRGGTGLGLAIAWRIVKEHNGTITAGNAAEGGAVIRVSLPISREAGCPSDQSPLGG
jgi:PAS domain S-box-containing protein